MESGEVEKLSKDVLFEKNLGIIPTLLWCQGEWNMLQLYDTPGKLT